MFSRLGYKFYLYVFYSTEGNSYDENNKGAPIRAKIKLVNISTEEEKLQELANTLSKTHKLDDESLNEKLQKVDDEHRDKNLKTNQYYKLDEKKPNEKEANKNSEKVSIDTKSRGKDEYNEMEIRINAAREQNSKNITNTANNAVEENNVHENHDQQINKNKEQKTNVFEEKETVKDKERQPANLLNEKSYTDKEKETKLDNTEIQHSEPSDSPKTVSTNIDQLYNTQEEYETSKVMTFEKIDKSTKQIHIDKLNVEHNKQQISKMIPQNTELTRTSLFSKSLPESVTNIKKFSTITTFTNVFQNKSQDIKPRPVSVTHDKDTSLSFKSDSLINKNHEVQKDKNNKTFESISTEKYKDYKLESIHENHNSDNWNRGDEQGKDTDNNRHQTKHTEKQLLKINEVNYKSTSTHMVLLNNPNQYSEGAEDLSNSKDDPCKELK